MCLEKKPCDNLLRYFWSLPLAASLSARRERNTAAVADRLLLEAENFDDCGGWVVDQEFMDQMGSPYLLAHGLGDPVRDAVTAARFPSAGTYRVWVRTRDWVAPWKAPGAPGRFQVLVDGKPLATTFGTEGAAWHWQDGGMVDVSSRAKVALHDLTGFEGRCDAIVFCKDANSSRPTIPRPWKSSAGSRSACRMSPSAAAATTSSWWVEASPARRPRFRPPGWD